MATFTKEQKEFITRRLAAFDSPRDVVTLFAALYRDTACNENDVLANDPRIAVVAPELHTLFYEERRRVIADPDAAIFADQAARLIVLSRLADRYISNNQPAEARAVFKQIAEEMGVIGGKGNGSGKAPDESKTPEFKSVEVKHVVVYPEPEAEPAAPAE